MELCRTISEVRQVVAAARKAGRTIGVAPTMGALHAGHASLIDAAVRDGHFVVVTIFVNPLQFGPREDLAKYPRSPQADLALCASHGAGAVFHPSVEEVYPRPTLITVAVPSLAEGLCGRSRPTHFAGVCVVVSKLFNIVLPEAAYFGQKDAQQAAIIRRMAEDLNFPVRVVVCPIVREGDGLAMSSRNVYLTADQRSQAPTLCASLQMAARRIGQGSAPASEVQAGMRELLARQAPLGEVDYIEIVDPGTLQPVEMIDQPVLIALAVKFGATRLIDNLVVDVPSPRP